MRRLLSTILAFLVLALSFFPCREAEAAFRNAGSGASILSAGDDDHCPSHSTELCSPFCTCSCCAGITLPVSFGWRLPPILSYDEAPKGAYIIPHTDLVTPPIWQPPQLV